MLTICLKYPVPVTVVYLYIVTTGSLFFLSRKDTGIRKVYVLGWYHTICLNHEGNIEAGAGTGARPKWRLQLQPKPRLQRLRLRNPVPPEPLQTVKGSSDSATLVLSNRVRGGVCSLPPVLRLKAVLAAGLEYSDGVLAYRLLDRAQLTPSQLDLVFASLDYASGGEKLFFHIFL